MTISKMNVWWCVTVSRLSLDTAVNEAKKQTKLKWTHTKYLFFLPCVNLFFRFTKFNILYWCLLYPILQKSNFLFCQAVFNIGHCLRICLLFNLHSPAINYHSNNCNNHSWNILKSQLWIKEQPPQCKNTNCFHVT